MGMAAYEMAGENLKLKWRAPKPKGSNSAKSGGNSGTSSAHKTVPLGMRRKPKPGRKQYK